MVCVEISSSYLSWHESTFLKAHKFITKEIILHSTWPNYFHIFAIAFNEMKFNDTVFLRVPTYKRYVTFFIC